MSGEVKIFWITGYMLVNHDRLPTWLKFTQEVTALHEREALEKIYSILGSRHKLKRYHIKISDIRTISPAEASKANISHIMKLERIVK
ncbi:MAG: 50S ribosomal protein L18Ae [Desulfurococcaceae archaeon]